MEQLILHLIGDYLLQTSYQAQNKTKSWKAAVAHALTYTLPFLLLTWNPISIGIIGISHLIIDRFALVKNLRKYEGPEYLTVWLSIIADNTVHLTINYLALL